MANIEHFSLLAKGISVWNEWRNNNPEIIPDLSDANLQGMYLECVNFEKVNLTGANLSQCKLRWARFDGAAIDNINIEEADVVNTALASILIKQKTEKERQKKLTRQSQETFKRYIQNFNIQSLEQQKKNAEISGFSRDYQKAIEESLKAFIHDGDDVACIGYYVYEYGYCEMCGHKPIKWHYILENLRNCSQIHIGSECVQNFQVILSKWGYRPEYIVFPNCLKPYTRWILDKNPQAIVFNDDIVIHLNKDCEETIKSMSNNNQLKHYRYVKRTNYEGIEKLIMVDRF